MKRENKNKVNNRAQAQIITIVLIILLVLGVMVILFNVVNKTLESRARGVDSGFKSFVKMIFDRTAECGDNICNSESGESESNCPVDCFKKDKIVLEVPILADFAGELRGADGKVDIDLMIQRLKGASINTYAFLLWHRPQTDWDDFLLFLEATKDENINVMAYLPAPEKYSGTYFACLNILPHRCDFEAWAKAFAELSLEYDHFIGWSIDDFHAYDIFTPESAANITYIANSINPEFGFYPIVYYRKFREFPVFSKYTDYINGIIFPFYYREEDLSGNRVCHTIESIVKLAPQIDSFNLIYNRNSSILKVNYPTDTRSNIGDYVLFTADISSLEDKDEFIFSNYIAAGKLAGYHMAEILFDGIQVWTKDIGDQTEDYRYSVDELETLSLSEYSGKVTIRVFENARVSKFPIDYRIYVPRGNWVGEKQGEFSFDILHTSDKDLDLITMVYGQPLTKCGVSTPEYVKNTTQVALDKIKSEDSVGVMIYVLKKGDDDIGPGSKYDYIKDLYSSFSMI